MEQLTLSELNALIKESLEIAFPEQLWVIAEIGELKVNRAGHCYIELVEKDEASDKILARSRATIWSWQFRFIQPYFETTTGQSLQAGLKVLVAISVEFHEVYGMSLNIKDIDPNYTLGDMARKRQEVINRLTDEGVFDMNKEIPLTDIPSRVAIISSPTAAGYEDFMNQLQNNEEGYVFYTKLFEATMQGTEATRSIIMALDQIYQVEDFFNCVVIIRGGGSQLDLSCFDDYDLALNITQFPIPVLTGIGHEKDESIADMVAHTRLKTPTAVAEFLISKFDEVAEEIAELENAFFNETQALLNREQTRLEHDLKLFKPLIKSKLERLQLRLQQTAKSVQPLVKESIETQRYRLAKFADHVAYTASSNLKMKNNQLKILSNQTEYASHLHSNKEFQKLDEKTERLLRLTKRKLENERNKIDWLNKETALIDPSAVLKRGFSITLKNGKAVKDTSKLKEGETLETILYKGKVKSIIKK